VRFPPPASHRSGLAQLTHPARQEWNSLRYARNHLLNATCAPEGERMRRFGSCGRVPVHSFHSRLSLLSAGSSGSLSLLHRYYEELRLLAVRCAAFVVLSQRYRAAFVSSLACDSNARSHAPGDIGFRLSTGPVRCIGDGEVSQVPARPLCALALLFDPGGTHVSGHCDTLVLPHFPELVWLPRALVSRGSITRLSRSLSTLRGVRSPAHLARLAFGGRPVLAERAWNPVGSPTRFHVTS
jgi:hypothetical protein